jgi:succinate dehydrogenase / fumarate reductase, cytochrome b subunit
MSDQYETCTVAPPLPRTFIERRLHSLLGFFLFLFLFEHLLTNSQAALFIGDDGKGFIDGVNFIHSLPYLPVIEISLLLIPFVLHIYWGVQYVLGASCNSFPTDGSKPSLTHFSRNHAFTWQRFSAVVLIFFLLFHVISLRYIGYPKEVKTNTGHLFLVELPKDPGLSTLAPRLKANLFEIEDIYKNLEHRDDRVIAACPDFGTAVLLTVRDHLSSISMCLFYSLFVFAAAFHALNGFWTFLIKWGITLTERSRMGARHFANAVMALFIFWGLAAIWGTFWINLKM